MGWIVGIWGRERASSALEIVGTNEERFHVPGEAMEYVRETREIATEIAREQVRGKSTRT